MREDRRSEGFFSYVRLEARIAADHPLRAIRDLVDEALRKLSAAFTGLYAREGRPLIPPEREKRANATRSSTTDPDARLFRKSAGKEAKLAHMGHLMMENRNGLIVDARLTEANGTAERTTALDMIEDNARPGSTVGGDKNYIMERLTSSPVVVNAAARRMSRRTIPTAARRSMRTRPAIPAMLSA